MDHYDTKSVGVLKSDVAELIQPIEYKPWLDR